VARDELETMLSHAELKQRNIPILFFANKCDAKNAASPAEIKHELDLERLCTTYGTRKQYHVFASNSLNGEGVLDGFSWLSIELEKGSKE
jgi:ADP-ribosylation factor-like protein 6